MKAPFAAVRYLKTLFNLRTYFFHQRNDLFEKRLDIFKEEELQTRLFNDFSLTIVETPEQLAALLPEGRDVGSCDFLNYAGEGIRKGAVLFFLFRGTELAHSSWVSMNNRAAFLDPIFERLRFDDAGCIGPCYTNPVYRGRGCYPYVLTRICAFLKERGKSSALINTKRLNQPSVRGIKKAGFQIIAEVLFLKVLIWKLCRVENVSYENKV